MKKKIILLLSAAMALLAFKKFNDVLTDVGTTMEEVKHNTMEQIAAKEFNVPYYSQQTKEACRHLPLGVRQATMLSLGKVIKEYVQSPQFKKEYDAFIEERYGHTHFNPNDPKWTEEKKGKNRRTHQGNVKPTGGGYVWPANGCAN